MASSEEVISQINKIIEDKALKVLKDALYFFTGDSKFKIEEYETTNTKIQKLTQRKKVEKGVSSIKSIIPEKLVLEKGSKVDLKQLLELKLGTKNKIYKLDKEQSGKVHTGDLISRSTNQFFHLILHYSNVII